MRWKNFVVVLLLTASSSIAITCYTEGVSNLRLQWNSSETVLNPSTVTSGRFGRLGTYKVDDYVYAHPLYAPRVTVGSRLRNLLIIADMSNYVYAFDGTHPGNPTYGARRPPAAQSYLSNLVYKGNVGCLATPVIDIANRWLFTLCANNNSSWVFSKLSLLTGSVISSLTVSATYPGNGLPGRWRLPQWRQRGLLPTKTVTRRGPALPLRTAKFI